MDAAAEFRALLAATPGAVTVAFGSNTAKAVLDFNGQASGPEGQAQVDGEIISLTYCTPDLPGLEPGSALTAGRGSYTVARGPYRRGDGLESMAILMEAL